MGYQNLTELKMGYQNLPKLDEFMENIRQRERLVKHKNKSIENYNTFAVGLFETYRDFMYKNYTFKYAIREGISSNNKVRDLITQMRQNDFGTQVDYCYCYIPTNIINVKDNLARVLTYYLGKVYRETGNTDLAYLILMLKECSEPSMLVVFYDMFEVIQESSRLLDNDLGIEIFGSRSFEKQLSEHLLSI